MDVNRVIKFDTLFLTPQYKNIINETDKIKYLDLFLIINYRSYFEGKMKLIRRKKIWMGPLNLYGWNGSF